MDAALIELHSRLIWFHDINNSRLNIRGNLLVKSFSDMRKYLPRSFSFDQGMGHQKLHFRTSLPWVTVILRRVHHMRCMSSNSSFWDFYFLLHVKPLLVAEYWQLLCDRRTSTVSYNRILVILAFSKWRKDHKGGKPFGWKQWVRHPWAFRVHILLRGNSVKWTSKHGKTKLKKHI